MTDDLNARLVAMNTLNAVFDGRKPLDQSLEKFAIKYELDAQDRGFAHALCGFVLRYKPSLQRLINAAAKRKRDVAPIHLNTILLMGAAQLFLMQTDDYAAIDTAVKLADKSGLKKQKSFVNAILRRFQRDENPTLRPAMPKWLYNTWVEDYGAETAKNISTSSSKEAPIGVTHRDGTWAIQKELTLTDECWVQDFASHLPVSLLGDIADKHVFDLCSAPGGKTMQLATKGAHVTSVDISERRIRRTTENLERTGLNKNVDLVCADLLKWNPESQADIIILDAPCSATGTIRRHPDLPYIRTPKDIKSLAALQYDLLNRAKKWVKNGGILVYCTCSLQKSEGENQINRFLENNTNFKRDPITDHEKWHTKDGDIRLLPSYGDMDGFFISILKHV